MATSHSTYHVELLNARTQDFIRFIQKIEVSETQFHEGTPCWIWQAYIHPVTGYGQFRYNDRLSNPHRFAYEYFVGTIPEGEEIDHKCHIRACANPIHLRTLTHAENMALRANCYVNSGQCKNGHKMEGENVRIDKRTGRLKCKACTRENVKRFYARNPDANRQACLRYQSRRRDRLKAAQTAKSIDTAS